MIFPGFAISWTCRPFTAIGVFRWSAITLSDFGSVGYLVGAERRASPIASGRWRLSRVRFDEAVSPSAQNTNRIVAANGRVMSGNP